MSIAWVAAQQNSAAQNAAAAANAAALGKLIRRHDHPGHGHDHRR